MYTGSQSLVPLMVNVQPSNLTTEPFITVMLYIRVQTLPLMVVVFPSSNIQSSVGAELVSAGSADTLTAMATRAKTATSARMPNLRVLSMLITSSSWNRQ